MALARPGNAALAFLGAILGGLAALPTPMPSPSLALAAGAALFGTAGGNILNDLMDRELDRVAHPERPLPQGRTRVPVAAAAWLVCWLACLGLAFTIGPLVGFAAALLLGLLASYELALKATGLAGNVVVAIVSGALFPFGALAVGTVGTLPVIIGALAACAHLGRELLKDAEDAVADRALRRTLAVQHGPRPAARAGAVALVAAVLLSPLPHLVAGWGNGYLLAVAIADAAFLHAAWNGTRHPGAAQRTAKLAMVVALASFLVGIFS